MLLYNCGTWSRTEVLAEKLDRFKQKSLRGVHDIKWIDKVTNSEIYEQSQVVRISGLVIDVRWRLFAHTLRMKEDTPARKAMVYYFCKDLPGRLGNRTTIASVLSNECKISTGMTINNLNEYAIGW